MLVAVASTAWRAIVCGPVNVPPAGLTTSVGGVISMTNDAVDGVLVLPAASTADATNWWLPAALTVNVGVVLIVGVPPSSAYTYVLTPDPPTLSAAVTVA